MTNENSKAAEAHPVERDVIQPEHITQDKKIRVDYGTHAYNERWVKEEYFCPNCGKQEVWGEQSEGDYYVGSSYLCLACDHAFYLPSGTFQDKMYSQRAQSLKAL